MSKEPLLSRSSLRKRQNEQDHASSAAKKNSQAADDLPLNQSATTDKSENEQSDEPITRSRFIENQKTRERSHSLNIAIGVVLIILAIMIYLVFNW